MKKLSIFLAFSATSLSALAQLQEGIWMLGTSIGSAGVTRPDGFYASRVTSLSLSPRAGYFVTDRLVLGVGLLANYARFKDVNMLSSRIQTLSVGVQPFGRVYLAGKKLKDPAGRLVPFVEGGIGIFGARYWGTVGNQTYNSGWGQGFNFHISPGASYFIAPSVAAEAHVKFSYTGGEDIATTTGTTFELGFQIFLDRSKRETLPEPAR